MAAEEFGFLRVINSECSGQRRSIRARSKGALTPLGFNRAVPSLNRHRLRATRTRAYSNRRGLVSVHLSPEVSTPSTKNRCRNKKTPTTGIIATKAPAKSSG